MRVAVFSSKPYDESFLAEANRGAGHDLHFLEARLNPATVPLAAGAGAVCLFVNDEASEEVLVGLHRLGVGLVALRSAGFNHVDLDAADRLGIEVVRVPGYSPHAVAEHALALVLVLDRKIHRAYNRVRENNFSLTGLLGFDLHGRTVGVVGTGQIGAVFARLMAAIGCRVLASDPVPDPDLAAHGVEYVSLHELFAASQIISLHCPLTPRTHHLVDAAALARMQDGTMLVNTSRGALVDTAAAIEALKTGRLGYLGLDVYEEEADLFFEDRSDRVVSDDVFSRLLTFPNVVITGHQGFFTVEALTTIAVTTIDGITAFADGKQLVNRLGRGRGSRPEPGRAGDR